MSNFIFYLIFICFAALNPEPEYSGWCLLVTTSIFIIKIIYFIFRKISADENNEKYINIFLNILYSLIY